MDSSAPFAAAPRILARCRTPAPGRQGQAAEGWRILLGARLLEELLAEVVEVYCARPPVRDIGHAGMADAPGRRAIGLGSAPDLDGALV